MKPPLFILFAVLFFHATHVTGLVCLSCDGVMQPRHCHQVKECQSGQYCAVERYFDSFNDAYYNLRCEDKEMCPFHNTTSQPTSYCTECCQGDLCNAKGCGTSGFPREIGPLCYSCKSLLKGRECHQIDICDRNEVCFVDETEELGDTLVDNGCRTTQSCHVRKGNGFDPSSIVGKRSMDERSLTHPNCTNCCGNNLCNDLCSIARDCLDIHIQRPQAPSGPYHITIGQHRSLEVWCDMTTDGGGWTVFQKRFNGSVDFYQTFAAYQSGFGSIDGEFWLGLENVYELTVGHNNTLRVDVTEYNGTHLHDKIPSFSLGPGPQYVLHVKGDSQTSREFLYFDGKAFTTKDVDHDSYEANCAVTFHGAFWYGSGCYIFANPNGQYNPAGANTPMTYNILSHGSRAIELKFRRFI